MDTSSCLRRSSISRAAKSGSCFFSRFRFLSVLASGLRFVSSVVWEAVYESCIGCATRADGKTLRHLESNLLSTSGVNCTWSLPCCSSAPPNPAYTDFVTRADLYRLTELDLFAQHIFLKKMTSYLTGPRCFRRDTGPAFCQS